MKKSHWFFCAFYLGSLILSLRVGYGFLFGSTKFVEDWGLTDPATGTNHAGIFLGQLISVTFFLSLILLGFLYVQAIQQQLSSHDEVLKEWDKKSEAFKKGELEADALVEQLAREATKGSRIRAALDSWQDASPNSDPEYIIEAQAAPHRQLLGILQTLASVLVLIGLVGNFFGLADAVRRLPDLADFGPTAPEQTVTRTKTFETRPVEKAPGVAEGVEFAEVTETTENQVDNSLPTRSSMRTNVQGISDGLAVVVISSVMGIGSMALLLILVAWCKAILNSVIADEVVLMSAEIGSALRPAGGGGFGQAAQDALAELPGKILSFDTSAKQLTDTLGKYGSDFGQIVTSLDKLLEHELKDAREAYQSYQATMEKFTNTMIDERASVNQLMDTTARLCSELDGIAKGLGSVAKHSENVGERLDAVQLQYETYIQAARKDMDESRGLIAESYRKLMDEGEERQAKHQAQTEKAFESLADRMGEKSSQTMESLRDELNRGLADRHSQEMAVLEKLLASIQSVQRELWDKNAEQHELQLETVAKLSEQSAEKLAGLTDKQVARLESQLQAIEALTNSQAEMQKAYLGKLDQHTGLGQTLEAAADALQEARQTLTDHRDKLVQVYDRLTQQQEIALKEMAGGWRPSPAAEGGSPTQPTGPVELAGLAELAAQLQALRKSLEAFKPGEVHLAGESVEALASRLGGANGKENNGGTSVVTGSFDLSEATLASWTSALQKQLEERLTPLVAEARRAADSTVETHQALKALPDLVREAAEHGRLKPGECPSCHHINPINVKHCEGCGFVGLPGAPYKTMERPIEDPVALADAIRKELEPLIAVSRSIVERLEVPPQVDTRELEHVAKEGFDSGNQALSELHGVVLELPQQMRKVLSPELEQLTAVLKRLRSQRRQENFPPEATIPADAPAAPVERVEEVTDRTEPTAAVPVPEATAPPRRNLLARFFGRKD